MHLLLFLSPDCLTFWHTIISHINSLGFLYIFCFSLTTANASNASTPSFLYSYRFKIILTNRQLSIKNVCRPYVATHLIIIIKYSNKQCIFSTLLQWCILIYRCHRSFSTSYFKYFASISNNNQLFIRIPLLRVAEVCMTTLLGILVRFGVIRSNYIQHFRVIHWLCFLDDDIERPKNGETLPNQATVQTYCEWNRRRMRTLTVSMFLCDKWPTLETLSFELLSITAVHLPFYISISIWNLPMQHIKDAWFTR